MEIWAASTFDYCDYAVNISIQISLQDPAFTPIGYAARSGIVGSY